MFNITGWNRIQLTHRAINWCTHSFPRFTYSLSFSAQLALLNAHPNTIGARYTFTDSLAHQLASWMGHTSTDFLQSQCSAVTSQYFQMENAHKNHWFRSLQSPTPKYHFEDALWFTRWIWTGTIRATRLLVSATFDDSFTLTSVSVSTKGTKGRRWRLFEKSQGVLVTRNTSAPKAYSSIKHFLTTFRIRCARTVHLDDHLWTGSGHVVSEGGHEMAERGGWGSGDARARLLIANWESSQYVK